MPIIIKTNQIKYKDSNGAYQSFNVIAQESTAQQLADIASAGQTQITAIQKKGTETLASIPDDYTELEGEVVNLKNEITEETKNNIISFKKIELKTINNVGVSTAGDGIFNLNGTCNSSGGRTSPVTDTFHLAAGTYTFSMYTDIPECSVWLCFSNTKLAKLTLSTNNRSKIYTLDDDEYYIAFNFSNGTVYNGDVSVSLLNGSYTNPPFEKPFSAVDGVARAQANSNHKDIAELKNILTVAVENVLFEQGTVKTGTGELADNDKRIRTKEIYRTNFTEAIVDANHNMWVAQYTESKAFLTIDTNNRKTITPDMLEETAAYVRFVIVNNDANTTITPEDETGFALNYNSIAVINNRIDSIDMSIVSKNRFFSTFKDSAFMLKGVTATSDATVIGNKYVGFTSGNDELTTAGIIEISEFSDGFQGNRTNTKTLYHVFGHCNVVDYSPVNDCLILGNGSGSYTLPGQIFIIPDFSSIINNDTVHTTSENPLTLSNTNAIVIDCSSYDLGTKFNVIWGEINNKKQNVAYLITAKYGSSTSSADAGDNGTIRRLLLGMGTNQLEYGQYTSAANDAFNGTFKILNIYTQDGTSYAQCNQGCCYDNGRIYAAIGHDGLWMWDMWLDPDGDHIWYDEYKQIEYDASGTVVKHNSSSVCASEEYLFFGQFGVGVFAIPKTNL